MGALSPLQDQEMERKRDKLGQERWMQFSIPKGGTILRVSKRQINVLKVSNKIYYNYVYKCVYILSWQGEVSEIRSCLVKVGQENPLET